MLYEFLLIFVGLHISMWLLGMAFEVPFLVLMAILIDFLTIGASVTSIEFPYHTSTAFGIASTQDPYLAIMLAVLLIIYAFTYYEMVIEGSEEIEGKEKIVWIPVEFLRR